MKKIITCASYHGTGSSAITDFLKEFEGIKCFGSYEFRFLQDPNGLGDLEERLLKNNNRLNSDRAIYDFKRFVKKISKRSIRFWKKNMYKKVFNDQFLVITNKYIDKLIDLEWKGSWGDSLLRDRDFPFNIIYKIKRIKIIFLKVIQEIFKTKQKINPVLEPFYYSYPSKEKFLNLTREYLESLWTATNVQEEILAFDQLVPVCNITKYLDYFNNIKVIAVDRDPRDLYVLNKYVWNEAVIPTENVDIFIKHFKLLREHRKFENEDENKVLRIRFEDFVYNYEKTTEILINFLELNEKKHVYKKKYFNPNISVKNTQLFKKKFVSKEEINKIEKELSEFCYNF